MQESLSDIIKAEKLAQNVTVESLSAIADTSPSTISRFLAGTIQSPSVYMVGRMCALLSISLDEYFGIDVPNVHDEENARLQAQMNAGDASHARMESFYLSALTRKDKIIRWLVAAVVVLASLSVGSYLVWDLTHADWGFFRG